MTFGAAGAPKSLVQGTGGMRANVGGKKPVQSKLIAVADVNEIGPEVIASPAELSCARSRGGAVLKNDRIGYYAPDMLPSDVYD
jgi:hypothetical protein